MPLPKTSKKEIEEEEETVEEEEREEHEPDLSDVAHLFRKRQEPAAFLQALPAGVRRLVSALQGLQGDTDAVAKQHHDELRALLRKYADLAAPITARRDAVASGVAEPTDEEVAAGKPEEFLAGLVLSEQHSEEAGVPDFWLRVLQRNAYTSALITQRDEFCLKHLRSVRTSLPPAEDAAEGFTVEFHFSPNDYFTNAVLTKTYRTWREADPSNPPVGCAIDWKPGKNLTVTLKQVTQRRKGKAARTVAKEVATDSFFNLFKTQTPEELEDPEAADVAEAEHKVGCVLRDDVIPHAVEWYAELRRNRRQASGEPLDDDEDGDEDDEDDEDDEEEPEDAPKRKRAKAPAPGEAEKPAECNPQ